MTDVHVEGSVAPGFEGVRDAFIANFRPDSPTRDVGAAFSVFRRGELVVSLWAGERSPGEAWTEDTLVNVYSTTKGLTATAVALLVDRGQLAYGERVSHYWPEFAQAGKQDITVAQLLSHQAGLPGFQDPTTLEDLFDWELVCKRLAAQAPMWPAGEHNAYQAMTYGFLAGELVRRVSGRSLGAFLADEIAGPLGADVHVGLSAKHDGRVAPLLEQVEDVRPDFSAFPPEAIAAFSNPVISATTPNLAAWRRAEMPAVNGHASARGIATVYAALANGGALGDVQLLKPETIDQLRAEQTERVDLCLGVGLGWGNGMMLNRPRWFGTSDKAFGHFGYGGSFGCADPDAGVSMGYVMSQMGTALLADPRANALVQATYASLD